MWSVGDNDFAESVNENSLLLRSKQNSFTMKQEGI